jgi:hypothetical protein
MKLVESRAAGRQKAVFSCDASAHARRWKQVAGVIDARLWAYPFEILRTPSRVDPNEIQKRRARILPFDSVLGGNLWKGRVLHLKGMLAGEDGASRVYQNVRPSNDNVRQDEARRVQQYLDAARKQHPEWSAHVLESFAHEEAAEDTALVQWAKQAATYWLGLIAYERHNFADSIDYLSKRTLETSATGFWTAGATYNLARAYEACGTREKAAEHYRSAAADWGAQLRAKWLKEKK